jgi:hypothetical protein
MIFHLPVPSKLPRAHFIWNCNNFLNDSHQHIICILNQVVRSSRFNYHHFFTAPGCHIIQVVPQVVDGNGIIMAFPVGIIRSANNIIPDSAGFSIIKKCPESVVIISGVKLNNDLYSAGNCLGSIIALIQQLGQLSPV